MIEGIFLELSLIIILAMIVSGFSSLLKQPLIIGYILTGIIASFMNIFPSVEAMSAFSNIGIALLLFMVGLNLNPKVVKELGKPSIITGFGQFTITTAIAYLICMYFGFSSITSLYIAAAIAFSSTIVVMKLLCDKGDTGTLYGYLSTGYLIIQDLIVIIILMLITSFSGGGSLTEIALETIFKGVGLLGLVFIFGFYVLPRVTEAIAKSQEYLLLFSLGWCFALSMMFYYFGFSIETGALLAGITLALSPYRYEIGSKMKPIRDFFLIIFFITVGSQITIGSVFEYIYPILALSIFVIVMKPVIITLFLGGLGYTKRTSFLTGATSGQISEFSLIMIALGVAAGQVVPEVLSIVTIVFFLTVAFSIYLMQYSDKVYPFFSKPLKVIERKSSRIDSRKSYKEDVYDVILFGYNRIGYDILESLKRMKKKYLVVDYDPLVIRKLTKDKIDCRYGDANDYELLNDLNLSKVKMVVSTIPTFETNLLLINKIKEENKNAIIITVSHQIDNATRLYREGATYVLMPHLLGGKQASTMIESYGFDLNKFLKEKITHLGNLSKREDLGHNKPRHERK